MSEQIVLAVYPAFAKKTPERDWRIITFPFDTALFPPGYVAESVT
jgi:hypothetical protein